MKSNYVRSFLKWPGGKYYILNHIIPRLEQADIFIEPFAGSAVVFLNVESDQYIVNDINPDLIDLYQTIKSQGKEFIHIAQSFFNTKNNESKKYYALRDKFNETTDPVMRSALFIYLNRHGYNGLCRYNKKEHAFNVPFGQYHKPYFPEKELIHFYNKAKKAHFVCQDYEKLLTNINDEAAIYADPPYIPLSKTAYFTQYAGNLFTIKDHKLLIYLSKQLVKKGNSIMISNHATLQTLRLYRGAKIKQFMVPRMISCRQRQSVKELLALYS